MWCGIGSVKVKTTDCAVCEMHNWTSLALTLREICELDSSVLPNIGETFASLCGYRIEIQFQIGFGPSITHYYLTHFQSGVLFPNLISHCRVSNHWLLSPDAPFKMSSPLALLFLLPTPQWKGDIAQEREEKREGKRPCIFFCIGRTMANDDDGIQMMNRAIDTHRRVVLGTMRPACEMIRQKAK